MRDVNDLILRELVHIRCILEGMYKDSTEHKKEDVDLDDVQERSLDLTHEYIENL